LAAQYWFYFEDVAQLAVLDADGYTISPDYRTWVKYESTGLANLKKCHQTSDI
jgi:hypothetical protein